MSNIFERRLRTSRQMNQRLNPLALAARTAHPRPRPLTPLQEAAAFATHYLVTLRARRAGATTAIAG